MYFMEQSMLHKIQRHMQTQAMHSRKILTNNQILTIVLRVLPKRTYFNRGTMTVEHCFSPCFNADFNGI